MMKITSIIEVKSEIVETDNAVWPTYRRHSASNWEQLMGESWENEDSCEDIESAYQAYKNLTKPIHRMNILEEETLYVTPQKK